MLANFWRDFDTFQTPLFLSLRHQTERPSESAETERFFKPAYDTEETNDHFIVSLDVPGVARDNLNIELHGNQLIVSGERKIANSALRSGLHERRHGKFQQIFALPDGVKAEDLEADYTDGVLRITIPKPAKAKPTKIKIGEGRAMAQVTN